MRDFKRLEIWRRAHALAIALYKATAGYGRLGYGHLRSQLMRAADSIATNIAEGCGTESNREFARFLDMSIKSDNGDRESPDQRSRLAADAARRMAPILGGS